MGGTVGITRFLRLVGWATATGALVGLVVFGLGGRLVMRILALTSSERVQGAFTDAGEEIGQVSLDGTIALLLFGGLGFGAIGGLFYAGIQPLLPARRGARLGVCAVTGAAAGAFVLVNPSGVDFGILDPLWLAVALVTLLGAAGGVAYCLVGDRLRPWYESTPVRGVRIVAFAPMIVLAIPVFSVVVVVAGVVWWLGQRFGVPGWVRPAARAVAAVAVVVLAVGALGKIADIEGREPRATDYVDPFPE